MEVQVVSACYRNVEGTTGKIVGTLTNEANVELVTAANCMVREVFTANLPECRASHVFGKFNWVKVITELFVKRLGMRPSTSADRAIVRLPRSSKEGITELYQPSGIKRTWVLKNTLTIPFRVQPYSLCTLTARFAITQSARNVQLSFVSNLLSNFDTESTLLGCTYISMETTARWFALMCMVSSVIYK
jgi:hypothetical protein